MKENGLVRRVAGVLFQTMAGEVLSKEVTFEQRLKRRQRGP